MQILTKSMLNLSSVMIIFLYRVRRVHIRAFLPQNQAVRKWLLADGTRQWILILQSGWVLNVDRTSQIQSIGHNTARSQLLAARWAASLERKIKHSAVEGRDVLLWET